MKFFMAACILLLGFTIPAVGQIPSSAPSSSQTETATDAGVAIAPPVNPATEEQIREYLSLNGTARNVRTVLGRTVAAMRAAAAPYFPASYWDDIATEFNNLDAISLYVSIYQKYISSDDMAAIIAFYRSPAGKRILATQAPIIADGTVVMGKVGREIGERVYAKHKDEIETAKKKYEAGNGVAAPSNK